MWKTIASRKAAGVFEALSEGRWRDTLGDIAPDVHHRFPGDNALGGERHSRAAMERWFERLFTVFPDLSFEVESIWVSGPPWDMWVAIEWIDRQTSPAPRRAGCRRGRRAADHRLTDPAREAACELLAGRGYAHGA
ncbi:MAG: nuclear transport factor 2 family protein [Solirubrobacterales bacterium]